MPAVTDQRVTIYLCNAIATSGGKGPGLVTVSEAEAAPLLASGAASRQPPPFGEVPGVGVSANPKRPR
jgi:hypothetical protein